MSSSRLITAALLLSLAGCGFQPLYGDRSAGGANVAEQLAGIAIPVIPDRIGQTVRNELLDGMTPRGVPASPTHVLRVRLREGNETQLLRSDSTASRLRYTLSADYQLVVGDWVAAAGNARSVVSFDLPESSGYYFTSVAAQRDAERQAAAEVAQQIKTRVAVYLAQAAGKAAPKP